MTDNHEKSKLIITIKPKLTVTSPVNTKINIDRIKGMIYGAIYGDVMGSAFERTKFQSTVILKPMYNFIRFQNQWKQGVLGQVTDDSEMSLMVMRHLVSNGMNYNREQMINQYIQWANSRMSFMGHNTRRLFYGIKTVNGYNNRYQKYFSTALQQEQAQSNGSLMRAYPFAIMGLLKPDSYIDAIRSDGMLTNPCPALITGTIQYVNLLIQLLQGNNRPNIPVDTPLQITTNKRWYQHAIDCTQWSLYNANNIRQYIINIIRLGGDTNASISGAALGAYYGYAKMSEDMQLNEEIHAILESDTSLGNYPRPDIYHPKHFQILINSCIM